MIEKITLKVFLGSMILCASVFITGIWMEPKSPETLFKFTATLFIIGFANFLIWATTIVYRLLDRKS